MKRFLLTLLAISTIAFSQAQESGIIYTDFQPDLCVSSIDFPNCFYDTIKIDFDQNGITDFKMYLSWRQTGEIAIDMISSWELRFKLSDNDSIVPSEEGWHIANYPIQYLFMDTTHLEDMIGFRTIINGDYYYAWSKVFADIQHTSTHDKVWANVDRIAFCTIPNYPLLWGQTEVIGVEENSESYEFATIHPNPTHGMVTIIGDNLHQAEVVNMLGQQVLCKLCKGNELQIDMTALPAGIYFVNITDELGRKCVHKVVKE